MAALGQTLEIRTSPHVHSGHSVDTIMFNVVAALLPTVAFALWAFGLAAAFTLAGALGSCLAAEWLACRLSEEESTLGDGSVAITGLLYGLTLPPACPLWIVIVGGFVAVGLGKALFGGLGQNPFNPALVGRAFLQAAFPVTMTRGRSPQRSCLRRVTRRSRPDLPGSITSIRTTSSTCTRR